MPGRLAQDIDASTLCAQFQHTGYCDALKDVQTFFSSSIMRSTALVLVLVALSATYANAFYLPGVAPKEFKPDDTVVLKYDKMDSTKTQLPYSIYDLPFCTPKDADKKDKDGNPDVVVVNAADNLGEVLAGDRMETSPYELRFKQKS